MLEHIERCTNVSNGWFNKGSNEDGLRPYNDIVTPIIDVAFRSEGFDVKDIVPFVDDKDSYHLSFLIKKYHPQWARKNKLDTFIDDVVESSIIYDLALIKNINEVKPELIDLKTIAFCDQTEIIAGPICIKHQYTISELVEFKGNWDNDKIDMAIVMSLAQKRAPLANNEAIKTPGKYIEVYELRGNLPSRWLDDKAEMFTYSPQMHIVCYYTSEDGSKNGICLYKGKDKPLNNNFKALKIDRIRSKGRACGKSVVERLFDPQVWNNYAGIKLKEMLDSAVNLLQTDSEEYGNQKISSLKNGTIIKHESGKPITRVDMQLQNIPALQNFQVTQENNARTLGSASEASLGKNPVSGTPFALQSLIVQQGDGIHEYRKGKIATFFADELYADWILEWLVKEMNEGKDFSEELSLDEIQEVVEPMSANYVEAKKKNKILNGGTVSPEELLGWKDEYVQTFIKGGNRKFFKDFKDAFKDLPIKVMVNVAGKQKDMSGVADKLSNLISRFLRSGVPISATSKPMNELLENSGFSPINFSSIVNAPPPEPLQVPNQALPNNTQPEAVQA
jgi:hypothetical protein